MLSGELVLWLGVVGLCVILGGAGLYYLRRVALSKDPRPREAASLEELDKLHQDGLISNDEYRRARRAALGLGNRPDSPAGVVDADQPPSTAGPAEANEPEA